MIAEDEITAAIKLLVNKGFVVKCNKKYVKHTYSIEENIKKEFHEKYKEFGFKTVREAMNDALSTWLDKYNEKA